MIEKNIPEEMIVKPDEELFYIELGQKIKSARNRLGISQEDIANAIGVSVSFFEKYENGTLAIPVYHFIPLLQYMKFPYELENLK